MAHSRLDRVGTIFSRITHLIRGGSMKEQEIPMWYEVYKTFPPMYEPSYDRPGSKEPLRNIYYEEDLVRAKFHKDIKFLPAISLQDKEVSYTRKFLNMYAQCQITQNAREVTSDRIMQSDDVKSTIAYERAMFQFMTIYSM